MVMVMAQCYCGGFSQTLFEGADPENGVAKRTRVGFFAQQYDLPAAGCRPDIENDEEYSSYFWGALIGQSRSGKPMPGCDADGDGRVSFDEAHAQALIAARTVDISLKTSDVLVRTVSRIPNYTLAAETARWLNSDRSEDEPESPEETSADANLLGMKGPVEELLKGTSLATRRVVVELGRELELPMTVDVTEVLGALQKHRVSRPFERGGGLPVRGPGRRSNSGRRELLAEVAEKWPELGDPEAWEKSDLLKSDDQLALLEEIEALIGPLRIITKNETAPDAPGMLSRHYAPATPTLLTENVRHLLETRMDQKIGLLLFQNPISGPRVMHQEILSPSGDLKEAAAHLYAALHRLDKMGLDVIIAERFPDSGLGRSINDRLERATKL